MSKLIKEQSLQQEIHDIIEKEGYVIVQLRQWNYLLEQYENCYLEHEDEGDLLDFDESYWIKWFYDDWIHYPYQVKLVLNYENHFIMDSIGITIPIEVIEKIIL